MLGTIMKWPAGVKIALAVLIAFGAFKGWMYFHDRGVESKYEAKVQDKIEKKTTKARDKADVSRVRDAEHVNQIQRENYDAIDKAPDGAPDAAHVQLGCVRLRRAGATDLPVACGSGGDLEASTDFGDRH